MIGRARLAPGLMLSLIAGTALAQGVSVPPDCTAYLTVQNRDCTVEHHYLCPSAAGPRLRIDFGQDGPFYMASTDEEGRWMWSQVLPDGEVSRFVDDTDEPVSLTQLLATGENRYSFRETRDGMAIRVTGYDRLTGERAIIDGEELLSTEYAYRMSTPDGQDLVSVSGHEYVSARHRRFFSGVRQFTDPDGQQVTRDSRPVDFVYPGEPGFLGEVPQHGCGALMSSLAQAGAPA